MSSDILIACVGKPSAGKSSLLNAFSDASAKVGNYPFTTIKPNHGVAYVIIDCPCAKYKKQDECNPRNGQCIEGRRYVPIKILDVAGLVPGASKGEGLGNQFLDDLRAATALIHVVDVSGTTDEAGKATVGYNPINDINWLRHEIHSWIFNNLMKKWDSVKRRHITSSRLC
jgi:ribosome-binding ATPase YchF (GTP1/OBG family)